ncbi:uncharacterized protein LOC105847182 isoform X2 [Hydra vulgaris]|uniref:uncharacterized protein LOC105847182 isoform X2 n=1 Tax=Hydra vulgaris TaxID=6087 RepID=UPI001F5EAECD|nr:uncharacterized protein LOC105847182 isoform X2 [Hydra vulgaris]
MSSQNSDFNLFFFDNGKKLGFKKRLRKKDHVNIGNSNSLNKSFKNITALSQFDNWKNTSKAEFFFEEAKLTFPSLLEDIAAYFSIAKKKKVNFLPNQANPFLFSNENSKGYIIYLSDLILDILNSNYSDFVKAVKYQQRESENLMEKNVPRETDSGVYSVPQSAMSQIKPGVIQKTKNKTLSAVTNLDTIESGVALITGLDKNIVETSLHNSSSLVRVLSSNDSGVTSSLDMGSSLSNKREPKTPAPVLRKSYNGRQINKNNEKVILNSMQKICIKKGETRFEKNQNDMMDVVIPPLSQDLISFSIASKTCHEKGWIMQESDVFNLEQQTLIAWAHARLTKAIKLREIQDEAAIKLGKKKSMSKCYYSDKSNKKSNQAKLSNPKTFSYAGCNGSLMLFYPSGQPAIITIPSLSVEGCYALVYSDFYGRLLAIFTPESDGACYYKSGMVQFLSTQEYGLCQEETGDIIRKWNWKSLRLQPSLSLQLNKNLVFRCSQKQSMVVFFTAHGQNTKVRVGYNGETLMDSTANKQHFSSIAVQLSKSIPCQKRSTSFKETFEDDQTLKNEAEFFIHLKVLKKKFKSTISEWMNYYRVATGYNTFLLSPKVNYRANKRSSILELATKIPFQQRAQSAPMLSHKGRSYKALPEKSCPKHFVEINSNSLTKSMRCDKKHVPLITDMEFDLFLNELPKTQLLVVSLVETGKKSSSADIYMQKLYQQLNKNRTYPCVQSINDPYRLLRYPIDRSLNEEPPLLVKRHNVCCGMFMMYQGGHLFFADYIFNGYGQTKKHFLKQIILTREDALKGNHLPKDFRFGSIITSPKNSFNEFNRLSNSTRVTISQ